MATRAFLAFAALLAVAGCNESDEDAGKVIATEHPKDLPAWLNTRDKYDPAVWLRSREVGHSVAASDAEVGRLRRALTQASARFYEDPRMIANRTAQIGEMLAAAGKPERLVDIITGLIDVADVSPAKKLYGEMCQHYLNIRKDGRDRTDALAQLTNAYKSGRPQTLRDKVP